MSTDINSPMFTMLVAVYIATVILLEDLIGLSPIYIILVSIMLFRNHRQEYANDTLVEALFFTAIRLVPFIIAYCVIGWPGALLLFLWVFANEKMCNFLRSVLTFCEESNHRIKCAYDRLFDNLPVWMQIISMYFCMMVQFIIALLPVLFALGCCMLAFALAFTMVSYLVILCLR